MNAANVVLRSVMLALGLTACVGSNPNNKAVYLLLDTSGTYSREVAKAQVVINYFLGTLNSGDSFAVARIDSESFTEKDIIARATFDNRPSTANAQKRVVQTVTSEYIAQVKASSNTDITGAMLQGLEYLNETGAAKKFIFVFSDMEEDVKADQVRDFPIDFTGITVTAIHIAKLSTDNIDPRDYIARLDYWKSRVEAGGGHWKTLNDLERLETALPR